MGKNITAIPRCNTRPAPVFAGQRKTQKKKKKLKMKSLSMIAMVMLVMAMLVSTIVVQASAQGRDSSEMASMADAIKYLQGLDKVYGQAARPRFGKRNYPRYLNFDADDLQPMNV